MRPPPRSRRQRRRRRPRPSALETKVADAEIRRLGSPTSGAGRAAKAGAHFRHAIEIAEALKTAKVEAKSATARRLQFKVESAAARRAALLQGTAAKSGAHVQEALLKANKVKTAHARATKENKEKCEGRLARAQARRAAHIATRVANSSRVANGRKALAALAC